MSNTDDKANFPTFEDILKGRSDNKNNHSDIAQQPRESGSNYALHVDPRLNDKSEYSQVGGKRINNQPYPSLGQQNNNPNQGSQQQNPLDTQSGYPSMDNQNTYSQPYNQQGVGQYSHPDANIHPDPRFSSPSGSYQQPDQGYGDSQYNSPMSQDAYNYSTPTDQGYTNQGYADPQAGNMDYANYQSPADNDPSRYSYPNDPNNASALGQGYDTNYNNAPYGAEDNQNYYDQSQQMGEEYYQDEFQAGEDFQDQVPRKKRMPMVAATLLTLMVAGGGLVYAYTNDMLPLGNSSSASISNPLLISKDSKPFKVRPDNPGGKDFPNRGKLIYDRLSGKARISADDKSKLAPRGEKVIDTASLTNKLNQGNNNTAGISVSNTAALQNDNKASGNNSAPSKIKTVKTIQVRPDGSFVGNSGGGSAIPGISLGGQDTSSISQQKSKDPGIAARTFSSGDSRQSIGNAFPPKRKTIEERRVTAPISKSEPKRVAVARQPEKALPSALSIQSSGSGKYAVQVAARRNETDALIAFADMQQKYPTILGNYQPLIQRADLTDKGKGVWYRLRVGPMSDKNQASNVCSKLKQQGIKGCFVKKL